MQVVVIALIVLATLALGLAAWSPLLRAYMARYDAYWLHVAGLGRVASARRTWAALVTPLSDASLEGQRRGTLRWLRLMVVTIGGLAIVAGYAARP